MNDPFEYEKVAIDVSDKINKRKVLPSTLDSTKLDEHYARLHHFITGERVEKQKQQVSQQYLQESKRINDVAGVEEHKASFQAHYLGQKNSQVSAFELPAGVKETSLDHTSSEIIKKYLDENVQFIPLSTNTMDSVYPRAVNEPGLYPGMTTIDSRKLQFNFHP